MIDRRMPSLPNPAQVAHEARFSSARERIIIQLVHWSVVLTIVILVAILNLKGHLSDSSTTAILGTALGHVGTSAAQKLSSRATTGGH